MSQDRATMANPLNLFCYFLRRDRFAFQSNPDPSFHELCDIFCRKRLLAVCYFPMGHDQCLERACIWTWAKRLAQAGLDAHLEYRQFLAIYRDAFRIAGVYFFDSRLWLCALACRAQRFHHGSDPSGVTARLDTLLYWAHPHAVDGAHLGQHLWFRILHIWRRTVDGGCEAAIPAE